jgi:hypothetical protein
MNDPIKPAHKGADALQLVCLLMLILVLVIQLWLLTSALDAYLNGDNHLILPGVLVSGSCLTIAAFLDRLTQRISR